MNWALFILAGIAYVPAFLWLMTGKYAPEPPVGMRTAMVSMIVASALTLLAWC